MYYESSSFEFAFYLHFEAYVEIWISFFTKRTLYNVITVQLLQNSCSSLHINHLDSLLFLSHISLSSANSFSNFSVFFRVAGPA